MSEFDYSYTVDSISDDGRTAQVTYTPEDERLEAITQGVPVPLHKATDEDHAKRIVKQKVQSYAPHSVWQKQLEAQQPAKNRPSLESLKAAVTADRDGETGRPVPVRVQTRRGEDE